MLWSFHRGGEHLVYEIHTRADAAGFELIIRKPDGAETVERFDDHLAVDRRAESCGGSFSTRAGGSPAIRGDNPVVFQLDPALYRMGHCLGGHARIFLTDFNIAAWPADCSVGSASTR